MKRPNPWRAIRSLINYAAVALATAAACDLYHHFADDPPDTWTYLPICLDQPTDVGEDAAHGEARP